MRLRRATPADVPALVQMMRASVDAFAVDAYTREERDAWKGRIHAERLLAFIDDAEEEGWVAVEDDAIIGFASRKARLVRFLYVAPQAARRGLGKMLFDRLEQDARRDGLDRLELDASRNSVPFYVRMGFQRMSVVGCGGDEILSMRMIKSLL